MILINVTACSGHNDSTSVNIPQEVYHWVTIVQSLFNVIANAWAYVIFSDTYWRKLCLGRLLLWLSIFEVFFNLFTFLYITLEHTELDSTLIKRNIALPHTVEVTIRCIQCIMLAMQLSRNGNVLLLAVFRFETVCRPTQQKLITLFRIPRIAAILVLLSVLLTIPRVLGTGVLYCMPDGEVLQTPPYLSQYSLYRYGYMTMCLFFFQTGGPVLIVCILNSCIIKKIRQFYIFRRQAFNFSESKYSSNKLVIVMCFVFAFLELPSFFSKVIEQLDPQLFSSEFAKFDLHFAIFCNMLIYLDSTLNAVIYYVANKHFRIIFWKKLGLCKNSERQETHKADIISL